MKGVLFRVRRNGWLHGLGLVCFSVLGSLAVSAAIIFYVMLQFGMEQAEFFAEDLLYDWLSYQNVQTESAYSLLVFFRPFLIEITENIDVYGVLFVLAVITMLVMFLYLMLCAGFHGKEKSPCLRGLERIPYDLLLPCMIAWIVFVCLWIMNLFFDVYYAGDILIRCLLWFAVLIFSVLRLLMITLAKIRTGTLFSGMLIVRMGHFLMYLLRKIPAVWKAAVIWGGVLLFLYLYAYLNFEAAKWFYGYYYAAFFFPVVGTAVFLILFFAGVWIIVQMDMVRRKAQRLAERGLEGNEEQIKAGCPVLPSFKNCLRDLDRISDGMNIAVEERMKSERFQTELITNVSHDIKTPLTSIINYLDFLSQEEKKENRNPQVVKEYMEVLDRQSVRLKKLIEDLIEASKASAGSLNIEKEPCELGIFLQQIAGEYEERLEHAKLTLNLSLPEKGVYVEADGRYLWRAVDNLLQNACKYAMANTRIYLLLQEQAGQAMIVIKNVSASELNISAEELMERFVRGDRSRHTEGSGLGLSIAKSLTELQGGKFAIEIDGDLFKTRIMFPIIPQNEPLHPAAFQSEESHPSVLQNKILNPAVLRNEISDSTLQNEV